MRKLIFGMGSIETLDYFSKQLCRAANKIGIDYSLVDIDDQSENLQQNLIKYRKNAECAAIVFNMRSDAKIWEECDIPVYNILVDHPRRFTEFMDHAISNLTLIVLDRVHVGYVKEHFSKVKNVFFMPLGGVREGKEFYRSAPDIIIEQPDLSGEDALKLMGVSRQIDYRAPEWEGYICKIADALEQNMRAVYKKRNDEKIV